MAQAQNNTVIKPNTANAQNSFLYMEVPFNLSECRCVSLNYGPAFPPRGTHGCQSYYSKNQPVVSVGMRGPPACAEHIPWKKGGSLRKVSSSTLSARKWVWCCTS